MQNVDKQLAIFLEHRAHLLGLAYRMLGSKSESEDVLQEVYERWHAQSLTDIENPQAFLATATTRIAIDHLRKHQHREHYVGAWLPEPLYGETLAEVGPFEVHSLYQSLSIAFLLLLEQLSPSERAVFLLKEAFDYSYSEIAEIVQKAPEACRQLCRRAKLRLEKANGHQEEVTGENDEGSIAKLVPALPDQQQFDEQQKLLFVFLSCLGQPDLTQLHQVLREDISLVSDGGGFVRSVLRPLHGIDRIARFFHAVQKRAFSQLTSSRLVNVNGQPGVMLELANGERSLFFVETIDQKISKIFIIRNPDKLPSLAIP